MLRWTNLNSAFSRIIAPTMIMTGRTSALHIAITDSYFLNRTERATRSPTTEGPARGGESIQERAGGGHFGGPLSEKNPGKKLVVNS